MQNGKLKPGYNVQLATENQLVLLIQYINVQQISGVLNRVQKHGEIHPCQVITDAGYGSEENYLYSLEEELRDRGFMINHKKVYRLMCELGVHSIICKKHGVWKNRVSRVFDNVLERNFKERTKMNCS